MKPTTAQLQPADLRQQAAGEADGSPTTAQRLRRLAWVGLNATGAQLGWFGCVVCAAQGRPAWGIGLALMLVALHTATAPRPAAEARLIGAVLIVGMAWDSLLAMTGVVEYRGNGWLPGLAPFWIGALWALFAATLNHSMRWLRDRRLAAVVFGAIAGPMSFWAGVRLGAARLPNAPMALAVLSIGWAVLLPALVQLAARLDPTSRLASKPADQSDA